MKNATTKIIALASLLAGCGAEGLGSDESLDIDNLHSDRGGIGVSEQAVTGSVTIDPRRSLAVTDQTIVSQFSLRAVLDQLAQQSGVSGLTGTQLFQQLWDTQNAAPGQTSGAHCSDNGNTLNTFPYACRPGDGAQASTAATTITQYIAIGLFNRFDLAPSDGSSCGEYRVVFAKNSTTAGRSLIIFEAVLPNPQPALGLEGCRPVQDFWAGLTSDNSVTSRATKLRNFYFTGLSGFSPVFHVDNYGNTGLSRPTGQIRTNQFIDPTWMLREFKLRKLSSTSLKFVPVTDKTNPFGDLFSPNRTNPLAAEFQDTFFPSQVAALAVNDINMFNYEVPDKFNTAQSDAQTFSAVDAYVSKFGTGTSALRTKIQAQLTTIGSTLTPDHIVARAQALSCAGCHQRSNNAPLGGTLTWPASDQFVHVSELSPETGPDGQRFRISSALTNVFLPRRKVVVESFLNANQQQTPPAPAACEHSLCSEGTRVTSTCDECAQQICAVDPYCCTIGWDSICVGEVSSVCGKSTCSTCQTITLPTAGCFWMENTTGNYCWTRPSGLLNYTQQQCFDMNSCGPGGGQSGGGCYKWSTLSF